MVSRAFQRGDGTLEGELRARMEQRGRWIREDQAKIEAGRPHPTPQDKRRRDRYYDAIQTHTEQIDLLSAVLRGAGLEVNGDER